jgi:CDP-diacylglycerol--serine O-phosphatidyltransferase
LVLPLSRLFPNRVTIAGLCCGLSAIRFALEGKFEISVALIVAAAIIDGLDGRIARLLNSTSTFGAQLDSLSDFVCFGVSPAIVMYLWKLNEAKSIGWALVLFFAVCCALRLARFNTNLAEEECESWQSKFFIGIPSPAGGLLLLMPLVISFYAPTDILTSAQFCAVWMAFIAMLMPSRIPTFAVKKIRVHHEWVLPIMLVCGFAIVVMLIEPWIMFTLCGLLYCATIPFSIRRYSKLAMMRKSAIPAESSSPER